MTKKVLISFIQDRSGSMATVWGETLNGFKTYVEDLQKDQAKDNEIEYLFSLTTFDTQIETPYLGELIAKVDGTLLKDHGPRGMTALYDAVGKTLQVLDDDKKLTFDKAIVVIVTDGEENSSREWSKDALHAAIDERIKRGNWTFTYLGTQPETWSDASSLGVGAGASATYSGANAGATYATMSVATANMARSVHASSRSFLADNLTRSERGFVGMTTEDDANDPLSATSGLPGATGLPVSGGLSGHAKIQPPPTAKPRTPKPPAKKDGRWR